MATEPSPVPIDAEARGKRRIFMQETAANWQRADRVFKVHARWPAEKIAHGGKDRHEARKKIRDLFRPVATLVTDTPPLLIWTVARALPESPFRGVDRPLSRDEEAADCVALFYLATAPSPVLMLMGTRCVILTAHGAGRFFFRGGADLGAALREAEQAILRAPDRSVPEMLESSEVWVPGGPGRFRCKFVSARSALDPSKAVLIVRLRSFYNTDMIPENEVQASDRLLMPAPEPSDRSLGEFVLHPWHMRRK
jgi:hypothetical protein